MSLADRAIDRPEARSQTAAAARPATKQGPSYLYLLLVLPAAFFLFPWVWLVLTSVKVQTQIVVWPPVWVPNPIYLENYLEAVRIFPFVQYMANTLTIAGLVVVGRLLSCSIAAYAFSHLRWPGRDAVFVLVLSTMMLPFQVTMIPQYIMFHRIGWTNSILPLTVPAFLGDAFFIFLLRQFFLTIPHELIDAATIDGSSEFGTFARIALPLAQPALATVVVLSFLNAYNDFLGPLLYLTDPEKRTLSLGMQMFSNDYSTSWGPQMATSVLITAPLVIVYFFTQKRFIQGIATTGFK
ncbi:MAG TPA: carbohydrate ABC transporter permease [Chloroflexota bacterium]|jgi:multiple sugar transport system permease protein|nr:carbohydrate ABC transporter permease [Chloroflexota bacterium]